MPERTVIRGGIVVTVDPSASVHDPGTVVVEDGRIVSVGPSPERGVADEHPADVLDVSGCIVVPGFINTHQHHWYNLFKGLGDGMLLEQWISDLLVPAGGQLSADELGVASRLSALEMIRSGTTLCLNHQVTTTDEARVDAILGPVSDSGLRQMFAKEVRPNPLEEQLAFAEHVFHRWNGAAGGRIRVAFAIESTAHWVALGTSSPELIQAGANLADKLGTRVTDHVAGGTMSREQGYLKFMLQTGRTDIAHLHHLGVLDEKWMLAHAIHATDRDIELIASSGAGVSHTPTAEASRGGGITPVKRMLVNGVNVTLGSDGPMVDTSVDMVEQMKAARLMQNQLHLDPSGLTPYDVLEMATIRGARALGVDSELGSLEVGKRADIAVFNLDTPWSTVVHHPVSALVHSVRGLDATHVLVDGEFLVREGSFVRTKSEELDEIATEARGRARGVIGRAGLGHLVPEVLRPSRS